MTRKIGFEKADKKVNKKSIADSYLDEFRARTAKPKPKQPESITKSSPRRKRNWVAIIFLCVWLVGWSFGIMFAAAIIASGDAPFFIFIWITAALAGWVIAFFILLGLIKGKIVGDSDG